ncbi:DUF362 domain-containing protein [Clostridium bowmanii]|uniref:DUF362 domain-containing protein n=1 Tax=Clostridium bowmanii TaxID=132925 RepID=UPI001C0C0C62|nr:DUF362 domain-containing protein [Clostridium bowmanii]MBU3190017.1 DUF362 domain-containing protein [Clostridium bowmanii]MCA1074546.1 DUF362 domain-containing protein [Clostridium bowmanii]
MIKVIIQECDNYNINAVIEKLNSGMELIGGWKSFVKPGMKVLLKVNLIGPKSSETAAVTHCEFVRAITRILKAMDCSVWIGDSSGGAIAGIAPTAQSFEVSGLNKVAKDEGAEIKNFDKEGVVECSINSDYGDKLYLAKPIFDADLVINLPKFKTHTAGIYTGAVKNVFGLIPGLKKAEYHKLLPDPKNFGSMLADIHENSKISLHIMDGITAMQGEGPTAGDVYNAHKILISTDPLALDTVAAKMIGLDIKDIPILNAAREKNIGQWDLENIQVCGDYDSSPELIDFKLPKRFNSKKKQNYKALIKVINFLKTRPKINLSVCKQCNMCVESCPVQAIDKDTKRIDYSKCIECMCCHELCRYKAVELKKDNIIAGLMTKFYRGKYK